MASHEEIVKGIQDRRRRWTEGIAKMKAERDRPWSIEEAFDELCELNDRLSAATAEIDEFVLLLVAESGLRLEDWNGSGTMPVDRDGRQKYDALRDSMGPDGPNGVFSTLVEALPVLSMKRALDEALRLQALNEWDAVPTLWEYHDQLIESAQKFALGKATIHDVAALIHETLNRQLSEDHRQEAMTQRAALMAINTKLYDSNRANLVKTGVTSMQRGKIDQTMEALGNVPREFRIALDLEGAPPPLENLVDPALEIVQLKSAWNKQMRKLRSDAKQTQSSNTETDSSNQDHDGRGIEDTEKADSEFDPEAVFFRQDEKEEAKRAVEERYRHLFPPREWEAFRLSNGEGLNNQEIAARMGCKPNTVKKLKAKASRRIKDHQTEIQQGTYQRPPRGRPPKCPPKEMI